MAFNLDKNDGPSKSKFNLSKADESTPDFQEPKKNNNIIWIVLAAIVVIGGGVYFATRGGDQAEPTPVASETAPAPSAATEAVTDTAATTPVETPVVTPPPSFAAAKFSKGSADVGSVEDSRIADVLTFLQANPTAVINIEGYASSEGELGFNQKLSTSRANNFANYLISKGVKSENINAVGKGIENPIASNDDEAGRSQNRRVEIKF